MAQTKYGKNVVTELKTPPFSPEAVAQYNEWASRILWIDSNVVEGAFQLNCSWYRKPNDTHLSEAHRHDTDEIIGFFGSNPDDQHDLGGEVEFWLEDEKHVITKSCLIFVPQGMKHCPMIIRRVDRPIFHFSTVASSSYELKKVCS